MKSKLFITSLFALILSFNSFAQQDTTLLVNGVCGMCKSTIESACELDGVESASWDVETKVLTLSFDPAAVSLEVINAAVNESGYDTEFSTAPEEAYQALHGCCHYREPEVQEAH